MAAWSVSKSLTLWPQAQDYYLKPEFKADGPPPSCVIRGESCSQGMLKHSDNTGTRKQEMCSFFSLSLVARFVDKQVSWNPDGHTAHQTVQLVVSQVEFFKSMQKRKWPAGGVGGWHTDDGKKTQRWSTAQQPRLRRNSYLAAREHLLRQECQQIFSQF